MYVVGKNRKYPGLLNVYCSTHNNGVLPLIVSFYNEGTFCLVDADIYRLNLLIKMLGQGAAYGYCVLIFVVNSQLAISVDVSVENITDVTYERAETIDDPCDSFLCENGGQCMTILSGQDGNQTKHAECVCHDRWIGPKCEALLILSPRRVTEFSVELRVSVQNPNTSRFLQDKYLKYTLQYWSNDSDTSCYKIPELTNITYEISDLTSGVFYHFCARTDIIAECATNPQNPLVLGSNCIGIVTRPGEQDTNDKGSPVPVLPIVISVILLLTAFTAFAVVFKCGYTIFKECGCSPPTALETCCHQNRTPAYDLFILPDNTCAANVNNQTPLMTETNQPNLQNPQSLTPLTQASVSAPPSAPTFFPLATDRTPAEQNQERLQPLMSQTNTDITDSGSADFIQIST